MANLVSTKKQTIAFIEKILFIFKNNRFKLLLTLDLAFYL